VVVYDLSLVGIAFMKFETNSPTLVDRHRPLLPAITLELVKTHTLQGTQVTYVNR
jgi:hypothetical protein